MDESESSSESEDEEDETQGWLFTLGVYLASAFTPGKCPD